MDPNPTATRIAELNDAFRSRAGYGGRILMTPAVASLPYDQRARVVSACLTFTAFTPDNDPYGEHDFGKVRLYRQDWLWKIDYYADARCEYGSPDPSDPAQTFRVMTIMHADDW